ncbi:hypothetical protein G3I40_44605, partial [Streptomyces sp. SID14478]|uniref:hypothetical protein n=1 Tax=Streptomyces sp. SID14478 TaxID=2706073 RepID=UPI00141155A5
MSKGQTARNRKERLGTAAMGMTGVERAGARPAQGATTAAPGVPEQRAAAAWAGAPQVPEQTR